MRPQLRSQGRQASMAHSVAVKSSRHSSRRATAAPAQASALCRRDADQCARAAPGRPFHSSSCFNPHYSPKCGPVQGRLASAHSASSARSIAAGSGQRMPARSKVGHAAIRDRSTILWPPRRSAFRIASGILAAAAIASAIMSAARRSPISASSGCWLERSGRTTRPSPPQSCVGPGERRPDSHEAWRGADERPRASLPKAALVASVTRWEGAASDACSDR